MNEPLGTRKLADFVEKLGSSRLIDSEGLERILGEFRARPSDERRYPTELTDLTNWLASRGLLTAWQLVNLCHGRWNGFFLDDYKLLDHLEVGEDCSYFLAEEVATGHRVALRVTPASLAAMPGKVEYRVVRQYD